MEEGKKGRRERGREKELEGIPETWEPGDTSLGRGGGGAHGWWVFVWEAELIKVLLGKSLASHA